MNPIATFPTRRGLDGRSLEVLVDLEFGKTGSKQIRKTLGILDCGVACHITRLVGGGMSLCEVVLQTTYF